MSEAGGQAVIVEEPLVPAHEDDPRERLHILTLFTGLGGALRGAWGAALGALYFVAQGQEWIAAILVGVVLVASLASILARYLSFSYRVEADEIDMASGILSRNQRSIPFDRIQDVNIEQGILHRIVGLAKVKFETGASAGKKEDDGALDSITLERANALRDLVRAHRAGGAIARPVASDTDTLPEIEEEERPTIFSMDLKRLLQLSLFSFSLAIVGALFGIAQTYGDVLGLDLFDADFWGGLLARAGPLQEYVEAHQVITVIFGVVTLLLAGFVTGLVRVIPREWNFALRRTETGFRRQRGLFTLTDVVIPLKRVQAAIVATGPIKRRNDFYVFKVQSLGRDSGNSGDHALAPLAHRAEISAILDEMEWRPAPPATEDWQRPRPGFLSSYLVASFPIVGLISLGTTSAIGGIIWNGRNEPFNPFIEGIPIFAACFGVLLVLNGLLRWLDFKHRRYLLDDDRILVRSGWWRQRLVILPLQKIQSVDVRTSFFKRWFGIADLKFGVAGGSGFAAHGVEGVGREDAYGIRETLLEPAR